MLLTILQILVIFIGQSKEKDKRGYREGDTESFTVKFTWLGTSFKIIVMTLVLPFFIIDKLRHQTSYLY